MLWIFEKWKWFTSILKPWWISPRHYCPGCTHGIAHRLVAEVIDEMGLAERHHRCSLGRMLRFLIQLPQF